MLEVVGVLAESRIRKTRNGESFGKYGQTVLKDDVNYRVLRTRKIERLRHEKINADSYTKRTAGRVAATPALQNTPVGLAQCTTQPHARCPLEYPHLAVASAYGTHARPPFASSFRRNRPASYLNLSPGQLPCLIQSTRTPNSSDRFTTICGSNIPNGSSQMANLPSVILTTLASRKCSTL